MHCDCERNQVGDNERVKAPWTDDRPTLSFGAENRRYFDILHLDREKYPSEEHISSEDLVGTSRSESSEYEQDIYEQCA